ncbi:hypothetical protein IID22_02080 [Patescibacteria group bacterium]|nr:hypothetical protein [Patescibacteria group bacterium]
MNYKNCEQCGIKLNLDEISGCPLCLEEEKQYEKSKIKTPNKTYGKSLKKRERKRGESLDEAIEFVRQGLNEELSLGKIGRKMGYSDHTTVLYFRNRYLFKEKEWVRK